MREEARALGHPTDHLSERLGEAIDIMRLAWEQASFSYSGRYWQIPEISVRPQPVQRGGIPIWIGGTGPKALRTTAEKDKGTLCRWEFRNA